MAAGPPCSARGDYMEDYEARRPALPTTRDGKIFSVTAGNQPLEQNLDTFISSGFRKSGGRDDTAAWQIAVGVGCLPGSPLGETP